ncbi:MAG: hypothetical protein F6J87_27715 [Spirulina sp. SIO3F2]|nr:hypothetical protein [Spirulina sp. SIO3F2]
MLLVWPDRLMTQPPPHRPRLPRPQNPRRQRRKRQRRAMPLSNRRLRWLQRSLRHLEWSYVTRFFGVAGLMFLLYWHPVRSRLIALLAAVRHEPTLPQPLPETAALFTGLQALGVVAIGHAEGNLTVTGDRTAAYWGHADPGNQRQNQGWCSDQGRGGGDPTLADRKCLERVQARLPQISQDFYRVGLDPATEPEGIINAVDLYNQAAPWVSRQFPQKYVLARRLGKTGEQALVWARVEAFRRDGQIDASGLIGICEREERPVTDWQCVAQDQQRRIRAIARVLAQG